MLVLANASNPISSLPTKLMQFSNLSGSVDILVMTMKIRDTRLVEIVICYVGRRDDGRSRTPAFCSHRLARLPGGAPALPNAGSSPLAIHIVGVFAYEVVKDTQGMDTAGSVERRLQGTDLNKIAGGKLGDASGR